MFRAGLGMHSDSCGDLWVFMGHWSKVRRLCDEGRSNSVRRLRERSSSKNKKKNRSSLKKKKKKRLWKKKKRLCICLCLVTLRAVATENSIDVSLSSDLITLCCLQLGCGQKVDLMSYGIGLCRAHKRLSNSVRSGSNNLRRLSKSVRRLRERSSSKKKKKKRLCICLCLVTLRAVATENSIDVSLSSDLITLCRL